MRSPIELRFDVNIRKAREKCKPGSMETMDIAELVV